MLRELASIGTRSHKKEIMDLEVRGYEETAETFRLIKHVNRFLGGTRVILTHLRQLSRRWPKGRLIRILDVATGASDIPQAIADWARKKGYRLCMVALDINPQVLTFASREIAGYPEITLIRASVFALPFRPASFDYVISSMFFHHLSEDEVVRVLQIFDRQALRGIIVNDLLRRLRSYCWIRLFAGLTRNEMFRHDAPLSVLRGYRRLEVEHLIRKSGLDYLRYQEHFGHRFAISGERKCTRTPEHQLKEK